MERNSHEHFTGQVLPRVTKVTPLNAQNNPADINVSPLYKQALRDPVTCQHPPELEVYTRS